MKNKALKDISSWINPLGPSRKVKAAIRKAVRRINETPDMDEKRLMRTIASKLGVPEGCVVFSGSAGLLLGSVLELLRPGAIWVAGPGNEGAGKKLIPPDINDRFLVDPAMIGRIGLNSGDVVMIPDPNAVTGRAAGPEAIQEVISAVRGRGGVTIVDQSLAGFTMLGAISPERVADGSVVVVGTTALYYGLPGLELAFALASRELVSKIAEGRGCCPNLLALAAARAALKDEAYVRASEEYFRREQAMIKKRLSASWVIHTSGTAGFLLERDADGKGDPVKQLARAGFAVGRWHDPSATGKEFYRITVMRHEENLKIAKALTFSDEEGRGARTS